MLEVYNKQSGTNGAYLIPNEGEQRLPFDGKDKKTYLKVIDYFLQTNYSELFAEAEKNYQMNGAQRILNFMKQNGLTNQDLALALALEISLRKKGY